MKFFYITSCEYAIISKVNIFSSENKSNEAIKVTIRFLSPEIRADGLEILIHQKRCEVNNLSDCIVQKLDTKLAEEIKLAILKRAVQIDKKITEKKVKELEDSIDFNRERIIDDLGEDILAITEGVSSLLQLVVKLDPYIIERDLPPTEDDVAS